MTTGDGGGTSGRARYEWGPWAFVAAVSVVVVAVNASSDFLEMRRAGHAFDWWEPVAWEVTSAIVIVSMAPAIGWALRRWMPRRDAPVGPALIHLGLTLPFAAVHIAGIYLMRQAIYWLTQGTYDFFKGGVLLVAFYEWRKDVLTYATIAATYWIFDYVAARRRTTSASNVDDRIEVRDGAAVMFLAPADILTVEAAGNYIEFHTHSRTHLVRGTLAAWEDRLSAKGFTRVHRSRLVNRARIGAIRPTPAGDFEIVLDTGRTVAGSRRYRESLRVTAESA